STSTSSRGSAGRSRSRKSRLRSRRPVAARRWRSSKPMAATRSPRTRKIGAKARRDPARRSAKAAIDRLEAARRRPYVETDCRWEGPMILLSNGGTNQHRSARRSDEMAIGTVDGVVLLERTGAAWTIKHRALVGCSVSAVTGLADGTLFAATHGVGVAR